MFTYIIRADGYMATAVKSEMNFLEFGEFVRVRSMPRNKREMPCFMVGAVEFVNPEVMSVNDFGNYLPVII